MAVSERDSGSRRRLLVVVVVVLVLVIGTVGLIAVLASKPPAAPVSAAQKPISLTATVQGSAGAKSEADHLAIQTDLQKTHEFAIEETKATGSIIQPPAAAIGDVVVINHSGSTLQIPAGTVVTSDTGQTFLTTQSVQTPPGGTCQLHDSCHLVPIRATQVGAAGNVPPHAIRRISGFSSSLVIADNLLPTTAGKDLVSVAVVTQQDHDTALAKAKADFEATLKLRASDHLRLDPAGRIPLPETEALTVTESVNHIAGDIAPTLTVYLDVVGTITTIDMTELQRVLKGALAQQAPAHASLLDPIHVDYHVVQPATSDGHVVLDTTASGVTE